MLEVAQIVRLHGESYLRQYRSSLSSAQKRALRDISACRTPLLGGHVYECGHCREKIFSYHSCLMGSISLWRVGWLNDARSKGRTRVQLTIKVWRILPSKARSVCPAAGMNLSGGAAERQPQWPRVFRLDPPECRFR